MQCLGCQLVVILGFRVHVCTCACACACLLYLSQSTATVVIYFLITRQQPTVCSGKCMWRSVKKKFFYQLMWRSFQARTLRLLAHAYLEWDSQQYWQRALNAIGLANAVSTQLSPLMQLTDRVLGTLMLIRLYIFYEELTLIVKSCLLCDLCLCKCSSYW